MKIGSQYFRYSCINGSSRVTTLLLELMNVEGNRPSSVALLLCNTPLVISSCLLGHTYRSDQVAAHWRALETYTPSLNELPLLLNRIYAGLTQTRLRPLSTSSIQLQYHSDISSPYFYPRPL